MTPREEMSELLAAYALGALTPEEAADVDATLLDNASARAELAEFLAATDLLAALPAERVPSAGLEQRLLAEARRVRPPAAAPTPIRPRGGAFAATRVMAAVAAVFAAVAVLLGAQLIHEQETTQAVVRIAAAGAPAAGSELRYLKNEQVAVLQVNGLQPLATNKVYEVWTIHGSDAPRGVGLFMVGIDGKARVAFTSALTAGDLVAVTAEPAGGSPAPTSQPLFAIKF